MYPGVFNDNRVKMVVHWCFAVLKAAVFFYAKATEPMISGTWGDPNGSI
jgi:hypothetical protein